MGQPLIRFGVFEADLKDGELRKQGLKIRLQDQPLQVLVMLLEHAGELVTREELQKKLWSTDTFVDFDRSLNKAINRLREALGDAAENPRFIETVPKRGYRFIAPVEPLEIDTNVPGPIAADAEAPSVPQLARRSAVVRTFEKFRWILAAILLVAAAALLLTRYLSRDQERTPFLRSSLLPPPSTSFLPYSFAISPDGTRLAFATVDRNGKAMLWLRSLSGPTAKQFEGTEGASFPFWSPDNQRLGFFADRKLKVVDVAGGVVRVLCDAPSGHGGAWSRDDVIIFAPSVSGPLFRIDSAGGLPLPITPRRAQADSQAHCWPSFLPDGKHFLFYVSRSVNGDALGNGAYVGTLGSSGFQLVSPELTGNVSYSSGQLLFVRDRALVAQPFDLNGLRLRGSLASIVEQELEPDRTFSFSGFTVSENGVLVLQSTADSPARLTWFDKTGKELGAFSDGVYLDPSFSPDGRRLAVSSDDARNGRYYIRVFDLLRGLSVRLTDGGSENRPTWSRDGREITYGALEGKLSSLRRIPIDGSGPSELLREGAFMIPKAWSPDGRLVFQSMENGLPFLSIYSTRDQSVSHLMPGADAQFSPDGKWIVYVGQGGVVGGGNIVVQQFPGSGPQIQISAMAGAQPRWSRDGRTIFYIAPDRKLMAADFDPGKGATAPRVVVQTRIVAPNLASFQYDVAPDGRFLINSFPSNDSSPLTLITGWTRPNAK